MTLKRTTIGFGVVILGAMLFAAFQVLSDGSSPAPSTGMIERQAVPEEITPDNTFTTPADAAIAKAREVGIEEPRADRFVLIFADEETVDLRVRVNGVDCAWFGVVGLVQEGKIGWSNAGSGDGRPCD